MKRCPKCNKSLSIDKFYFRKTGPRVGEHYEKCKNCMKIRGRKYYHNNHSRQLKLALIRRHRAYDEKRSFLVKEKDRPCGDCGMKYPFYVMDFDHQNPKNKTREVSYMFTRNWSLDKIKKETKKCEVVCSNCHRIRTYKERCNRFINAEVAKVVTAGL